MSFTRVHVAEGRVNGFHVSRESRDCSRGVNHLCTCRESGITVTGEQIIGDLFYDKKQLLPFVVSPLGLFGPTINHFLYGITPTKPSTLHNISQTKFPNAFNIAKQAFSPKTPSGILQRADSIWLKKQPQYNYGGSYRSPTPSTYYTQMFGREVCFAN